ncbi:MAG: hypothetical protein AAB071_00455 [Bacteroidota bacterium]
MNYDSYMKIMLLLFCVAMMQTCKEKPVENNDDDKPGRRDYTWTIDTLSYPGSLQTSMYDMYAVNTKNIYVVGHNEVGDGKMYHYNGINWQPVKLHPSQGGHIEGAIDLSAIYGFGANDIWAVGYRDYFDPVLRKSHDSTLIIHYNGSQWREANIDYEKGELQGVWGSAPNDVWAGGTYGTLYHYDGSVWNKQSFDTTLWISNFGGNASEQFVNAYKRIDTAGYFATIHCLLSYKETIWTIIEKFAEIPNAQWTFGHSSIRYIDNEFYSAGYGLFKKKNDTWQRLFDSGADSFLDVFGTRNKNIFVIGVYGIVYHFNGNNWKKLDELYNTSLSYFSSGWTNEKEVFLLASDNYKTYIYHGK